MGTGLLISFDGIDCSGKSTQIEAAAGKLREAGIDARVDARQSIGPIAPVLLNALSEDGPALPPECLAHLFTAEAIWRQQEFVAPWLRDGAVVLSDRSFYSGFAFNIALGATSWRWNEVCNEWAIRPHLAIYIDVDPNVAWSRRCGRADARRGAIEVGFESATEKAFVRTQTAAREVFNYFVQTGLMAVVNGNADVNRVGAEVWMLVHGCLTNNGYG